MFAEHKKLRAAAFKLALIFKGAELAEVESMLVSRFHNALHHNPYDPSRGKTESEYGGIVLANAVHRVSRELSREARRAARVVSLDAMIEESEVRDGE